MTVQLDDGRDVLSGRRLCLVLALEVHHAHRCESGIVGRPVFDADLRFF